MTGDDWGRLGDRAESLTDWTQNHAFMRMHEGRCIALAVDDDGVRCTIYADRPDVCRTLARGGGACEVERAQKRLPVISPSRRG